MHEDGASDQTIADQDLTGSAVDQVGRSRSSQGDFGSLWRTTQSRAVLTYTRFRSRVTSRDIPIFLLVALYVGYFSVESSHVLDGRAYPSFDLAIFDQGIWLLSHFHSPFSTIIGRPLLGDHTQFILIPVAVIYRLFPEPLGILVMQSLFTGATALPIYFSARRLTNSRVIATSLGAAFLFNPTIQQANMMQFHPECFLIFFIVMAAYAALESRYVLLLVMSFLALMVKEDAAVLVIPIAIWVFFRRDRLWGSRILVLAVAWAVAINFFIQRAILGYPTIYSDRIPFGGFGGVVKTLIRTPGQIIDYLRSDGRPYYLWQLGFMNGFTFLLAPEIAAFGILVIVENLLSSNIYMHTSSFWYSLPLVGLLSMGTVWAVSRQKNVRRQRFWTGVSLLCAIWACIMWGLAPFSNAKINGGLDANSASYKAMTFVEQGIPSSASVSAYYYPWNTALDHRTHIYSWPNPFSNYAYGLPSQSGQRMPGAGQVQFLVLPNPLPSATDQTVFKSIRAQFHLARSANGWRLYERNRPVGNG